VADALPILKRARFVEMVSVQRHEDDEAPAGIDVAAYFDRHQVRASFSSMSSASRANTGATLVSKASAAHADLLVLGAYGPHTRGRTAARWLDSNDGRIEMTVPVLMSH
jgi:nucleotide-binding universal stress UspA family protein